MNNNITRDTQLMLLDDGSIAIIAEDHSYVAVVRPDEQFVCGDLYEGYPKDAPEGWYPDFPSDLIQSCEHMRVAFDNGSMCLAGHVHVYEDYHF
jgi:hypothetical protein